MWLREAKRIENKTKQNIESFCTWFLFVLICFVLFSLVQDHGEDKTVDSGPSLPELKPASPTRQLGASVPQFPHL